MSEKTASRGGALVTGAARRIGRALALEAAGAGYDVAIHCREADADGASLAEEIAGLGRRAVILPADLTAEGAPAALMAGAKAVGPLTLLVNCASVFEDDRIETLTPESFDTAIAANLRAPILLAQAFAAQAPADRRALIVNLLDQRVWRPNPQYFSYAISKGALWHATRMLAQALAPQIRVNAIGPGPTLPSIHQSEADFEAEAHATLLQRGSPPEALAEALAYLVDAKSVTGQMIAVDGGQHLNWKTADLPE